MLRPHLRKGWLVLDAGCGDGKTSEALARVCEVVACDFSREALLSMRSQRDPERVSNLVECNILGLPFAPEKFHAVTCVHALSHMTAKERSAAAAGLSSAVMRDGHLYIEVFGRRDIRYGKGEQVEPDSFLRGDGIMTHYFGEGEVKGLFPGTDVVSEVDCVRRVAFGAVAGKRHLLKVLLVKR